MAKKRPDSNHHADNRSNGEATYFLSLAVENVRCFGPKQTLALSDANGRPAQWTILLGNNGTGKTTLLQLLAYSALLPQRDSPRDGLRIMQNTPNRLIRVPEECGAFEADLVTGAGLREMARGCQRGTVSVTIKDETQSGVWETGYLSSVESVPANLRLPTVCCAYGAARRMGTGAIAEGEEDSPTRTLFSDSAELRNAQEWLLRLDYASGKHSPRQQWQKERLAQVKQLLIEILPEVKDIRFVVPTGVYPVPWVEFKNPYGWVPLRQLGYGYQTLIAWMVDFASRMVERYPDSHDPLAEPAVVLVDEIDLHLHPVWQRKLIDDLSRLFPNTQFIATAHSPLIVQAASKANVAVLRREGDHVMIDNDVEAIKGWRIDQVLTSDLFGLESARPPEMDKPLARWRELQSKGRLTKNERQELARLEEEIGELPDWESPAEAKIVSTIEETLNLLKQQQGS